jgi:micrococcal nuclease
MKVARTLVALVVAAVVVTLFGTDLNAALRDAGDRVTAPDGRTAIRLRPAAALDGPWQVIRVVDGDTVTVRRAGTSRRVRLIGINTPETVAPRRRVECYGPQASAFAKRTLTGASVYLEYDRVAGRTDRYGRTLAYLWTDRTHSYNLAAISRGYAREYTHDRQRYAHRAAFTAAQLQARTEQRGLWGAC